MYPLAHYLLQPKSCEEVVTKFSCFWLPTCSFMCAVFAEKTLQTDTDLFSLDTVLEGRSGVLAKSGVLGADQSSSDAPPAHDLTAQQALDAETFTLEPVDVTTVGMYHSCVWQKLVPVMHWFWLLSSLCSVLSSNLQHIIYFVIIILSSDIWTVCFHDLFCFF